jgi:hypothetical protein
MIDLVHPSHKPKSKDIHQNRNGIDAGNTNDLAPIRFHSDDDNNGNIEV